MKRQATRLRVLYSFPHKIGAERICHTAWEQVNGLAAAGAEVRVFPGAVHRRLPDNVVVQSTLARGRIRIPYRFIGSRRAFAFHDYIVAKRLRTLAGQIDIVHTWPQGALRTLETAAQLRIPTVLERPNAHTRFAYETVRQECDRVGIALPADHEHAYNDEVLAKEEVEYRLATRLLCPSDFVLHTFLERGFSSDRLERHQYGFDQSVYYPTRDVGANGDRIVMLFVGGCAPRKGLHYALEAWLQSQACRNGEFLIAGGFVPGYAERLSSMLSHPSVKVLGHRRDVPSLMRSSDLLILPTVEEGSALVTSEAMGSGCVLLVSDAAGAMCEHMKTGLVHSPGDVASLTEHIDLLNRDRDLLKRLRAASLRSAANLTWTAAGRRLLEVYEKTIAEFRTVYV